MCICTFPNPIKRDLFSSGSGGGANVVADLPPDLLRLISGSLRDAGDFVRFHAACEAWRDTPPASHPQFLPWLLAPGGSIAQFRSIFSNSKTTWCAPGTYSLRSRWLATEDGAGAWLLTSEAGPSPSLRLVDPFTGAAATLPPFATQTPEHIPYADGTVVMFAIEDFCKYDCYIWAAVLRPGGTAWTEGRTHLLMHNSCGGNWAAAYHKGEIVLVDLLQVDIVKLPVTSGDLLEVTEARKRAPPWSSFPHYGPQPRPERIYTFESRGELLAACLLLDTTEKDGGDSRAPAGAMSVSIYALDPEVVDSIDKPRWVTRDARSLGDRVLFLGCPTSFAVDAPRLGGAVSGGCAYFVLNLRKACLACRNVPDACRVYRYSFEDGSATVVDELPTGAGWDDDAVMMWFTPRPCFIAPAREIRERLLQDANKQQGAPCPRTRSIIRAPRTRSTISAPRTVFGPQFTIFVGNLPSWVDSLKLEQFFWRLGKVADARVIRDRRRYNSWGFGVITMATVDQPADVFAALDGEHFFGHVLRVKFTAERPEGPFVMPLLAPN